MLITETKLLGVMINNSLTWDTNTKYITKRANARMRMLHKLVEFNVPEEVNIFILYIRSVGTVMPGVAQQFDL